MLSHVNAEASSFCSRRVRFHFKSGAWHIDHKHTCISRRKGNIDKLQACLIHSGIPRTFPDLLEMPGGAVMRHSATLWVWRVEASVGMIHVNCLDCLDIRYSSERGMKVGLSNCPSGSSCFFRVSCRVHPQIFRQVIRAIPRLTALLKQA